MQCGTNPGTNQFCLCHGFKLPLWNGLCLKVGATKSIHNKSSQVIRGNTYHLREVARTAGAEWPVAATAAHALAVPATVIQSERKSNEAMDMDCPS